MQRTRFSSVIPFLIVPVLLSTIQVLASVSVRSPAELAALPKLEATVTRVIDGSTIEVSIEGQSFQVSYLGLDIPQPVGQSYFSADIAYQAAAQANGELVEGQAVQLERDITHVDSDGKLLRWVWLGGALINEAMVRNGLAQVNVTPPNNRYEDVLFAAQDKARIASAGIWAGDEEDCETCKYLQAQYAKEAEASF